MTQEEFEQNQMHRRTGIEAYAGLMAKMASQVTGERADPATVELIKEGIVASLSPPPLPPLPTFPVQLPDPPPKMTQSQIFIEKRDGHTAVYDFGALTSGATHFVRDDSSGEIVIWKHQEQLARLSGPIAFAYWKWHEEHLAYSCWQKGELPPVDAEFVSGGFGE
jgi:hypothetical protein